ncbi:ABC transporter permease [Bordetella pertussis]|nr:ABC transporter permease [Bordetella pertussis]
MLWPGLLLSLCILSINLLGDTARDMLDPRLKRRGE